SSDPDGLRDLGNRHLHRGPERRHRDAHDVAAHTERAVDAEHAIDILVPGMETIVGLFEAHVDEDKERARDAGHESDDVEQKEKRVPLQELPTEVEVLPEHCALPFM